MRRSGFGLREVIEFASYYLAAQADRLKLTAINIAMFVILGAIGAFVGTAIVLTAGVLLIVGIAGGLGALFGGRLWLGDLATAILVLGILFAGTIIVFKKVTGTTRGKLVSAYEQRKSQQRATLGTDVDVESKP